MKKTVSVFHLKKLKETESIPINYVSWNHKMPMPEAKLGERQQDVALLKNCSQEDKSLG